MSQCYDNALNVAAPATPITIPANPTLVVNNDTAPIIVQPEEDVIYVTR